VLLDDLVRKSLVVAESVIAEEAEEAPDEDRGMRYRLLEMPRQFALEQLCERGEELTVRDRHLAHFARFMTETEQRLPLPGATQGRRIEREYANIRAALEWSLAVASDPDVNADAVDRADALERGVQMSKGALDFWFARGHVADVRRLFTQLAARQDHLQGTVANARLRLLVGSTASAMDDYATGGKLLTEALAAARALGDTAGASEARKFLAFMALERGDYESARTLANQCLPDFRAASDDSSVAVALFVDGLSAVFQGDYGHGALLLAKSLECARRGQNRMNTARAHFGFGMLGLYQGDYAAAEDYFQESYNVTRQLSIQRGYCLSLHYLACVAFFREDRGAAASRLREMLALVRSPQYPVGAAFGLAMTVHLLTTGSDEHSRADVAAVVPSTPDPFRHAARLVGAGCRITSGLDLRLPPMEERLRREAAERCRAILGAAEFADATGHGEALSPDEALEEAIASLA
jgi:tetratricopeptide (TPR) repeat protein